MSEAETELQEIEVNIEILEEAVKRADTVKRLSENKDFQEIVDKGYFADEAARMLLLRDDPNLPADKKKFLEADMYGPGAFKRYLSTIVTMGNIAANQIAELKETMDEINEEMVAEDGEDS
jgi:hypothetical protein